MGNKKGVKAWQVSANEVLVQLPYLGHAYYKSKNFIQAMQEIPSNDSVIINLMKSYGLKLRKNDSTKNKVLFLLEFHEDVVFNNNVFSMAAG